MKITGKSDVLTAACVAEIVVGVLSELPTSASLSDEEVDTVVTGALANPVKEGA